jgi:hypothetical protein
MEVWAAGDENHSPQPKIASENNISGALLLKLE